MIEAVDLFCGAGGLTAGLRQAGISVHAGYDIEESCRYAFEWNNNAVFCKKDVSEVTGEELSEWYSNDGRRIRLLAGCAPCQPFSSYNKGRDTTKDKKWPLLGAFARLIRETLPELVTMENVPDVTKHDIYHEFAQTLKDLNYHIWAGPIACREYGLPQQRVRHVMLASRLGPIEIIPPTHRERYVTVRDVLTGLPPIAAGEIHPSDPLHRAQGMADLTLRRIRASKPGGTWRDWPEELRAECHRKASGKTYSGVYGRMEWDKPSPTITTLCCGFGNGRFGHPQQDRAITLREAALLQSFPSDYRFVEPTKPVHIAKVCRMIGNAVPVRLGEIIGQSFIEHVKKIRRHKDISNSLARYTN